MNLRDLSYLVAIGEYGHFGHAADACYVSQPTLSTQIKKLERELGVQLVERSTKSARLTEVGQKVVERAQVMLAEEESIRNITRQAQDPESGSLRLGLFPTLAPYLLPHVVQPLHERFPKMEFLLVEEKTEVLLEQLAKGDIDAAFLAEPVHAPGLIEDHLFTESFMLAVPASSSLADRTQPMNVSELATEPILLLEDGHCLRDQALSVCKMAGASERAGFRATSLETLRQMVATNVGVTLLPELAVRPPVPVQPNVKLLPFAEPRPARSIALYWRPSSFYGEVLADVAGVVRSITVPLLAEEHSPTA